MEWEDIVIDEKHMSVLFEFANPWQAGRVSNELSKAIWGKGELSDLDGYVNGTVCAGKYVAVATDASREEIDCIVDFVRELSNVTNESYNDEPSPFETYEAYVAADLEDILNERGIRGSGHNKYLDTLDKDLHIRKELRRFFEEDVDEEEAAERLINLIDEKGINEDFSMGVSGPTGLNQGIPHGGPGKGCLPKPLYNPKAKAVPPKKEDDKDTEENLKKLRSAKKLLKTEGFALVRENAGPLMDPIDQFENYLHDNCDFSWDEVDSLVDANREMIKDKLEQGLSFENISASLDDSCLRF